MRADRRPLVVLGVVAALLLVGAYLMSRGSADAAPASDVGADGVRAGRKERVIYPRDKKRVRVTRKLDDPRPPEERQRVQDALQNALLVDDKRGAVFIEANAIRHAPLMEKILRCRENETAASLERMKEVLGVDPMEDIDRVGFNGDVFAASGFFDNLKVPEEVGEGAAYGDAGRIWHLQDDEGADMVFGRLGNGLLMSGRTEAELKGAMDRAEGRAPAATTTTPAGFGEAELYGTLTGAFLQQMLGGSQDPTAMKIAELVLSSQIRMNVDQDAAVSMDVVTRDEASSEELMKTLNGGLALLRARATQQGETDVAYLLDQARVESAEGGGLMLDIAVPGEFLLKSMGCDPQGNPLPQGTGR